MRTTVSHPPAEDDGDALIVIPCLNEAKHIEALLTQITGGCPDTVVVVADGGSTDGSQALVERCAASMPNVRLLDNPKRLQSAAVNLAAREFGTGRRWLVRIDAHCRYPDGYVAGLLAAARAHDATSVVVPMVTRGEACLQRAIAAAQNSVLGTGGSAHRHVGHGRFVDHGHHALFDLAAFRAVGGYDESFSHNEDAELDQRLIKAGGRIWLEPEQAIIYFPRRTLTSLFRQYLNYGIGRARTLARHRAPMKLRQAAPLVVAPAVAIAMVGLVAALRWPLAGALALPAIAWASICLGYGALLAVRSRSLCVLAAGVAAMTMHLAWSAGFLYARWRSLRPRFAPGPIVRDAG